LEGTVHVRRHAALLVEQCVVAVVQLYALLRAIHSATGCAQENVPKLLLHDLTARLMPTIYATRTGKDVPAGVLHCVLQAAAQQLIRVLSTPQLVVRDVSIAADLHDMSEVNVPLAIHLVTAGGACRVPRADARKSRCPEELPLHELR
jgi:hypothetical protein